VPLAVPNAWRNQRRSRYIDSVEYMDWNLGRFLERLEELELARRTVIAFTSDNGSWRLRSNGGLRGGKKSVYEGGVRVPLIVSYPGLPGPRPEIDTPTMMCDLFPTLLRLAGGAEQEGLDGRHLLNLMGVERTDEAFGRRPGDPFFPTGTCGCCSGGPLEAAPETSRADSADSGSPESEVWEADQECRPE